MLELMARGGMRINELLGLKPADIDESGSRGFFSPSPHNTLRAAPHRAFHQDYRAVAG